MINAMIIGDDTYKILIYANCSLSDKMYYVRYNNVQGLG